MLNPAAQLVAANLAGTDLDQSLLAYGVETTVQLFPGDPVPTLDEDTPTGSLCASVLT